MKVRAQCGYCLLHRGYHEILRTTEDEILRFKAVKKLLKLLGEEFKPGAVPSLIGSERDRLIKRVTKCPDPYSEMKKQANRKALQMLPQVEAMLKAQPAGEQFRTVCKISSIGNIIEYDVPNHRHDIDEALDEIKEFHIDDTDKFKRLLAPGFNVLLLTDNAGEIAFDVLLVQELQRLGCKVTTAVKGGPSLNDALVEDAVAVGMAEQADVLCTTGTDAIGVNLFESSDEFKNVFYQADAIVSKGMANWETLSEWPAPCPTLFLFRTKCEPVADSVGAPVNQNIAKFVPKGGRLRG